MLHKVNIAYIKLFDDGRMRPAHHTVFVEAETGDEAAAAALSVHGNKCPDQMPDTRVGVQGVDCPTAEEVAAFNAPDETPKRGRKAA